MYSKQDICFIHPSCMMVAGPTQSGKSFFIYNLLVNKKNLITPEIDKIIYCYSVWQPLYEKMLVEVNNITFNKGLPSPETLKDAIIILDDLMCECIQNKQILDLFTVGSHHRNLSVIFLTQNVYEKGKYARAISINSHYLVLFKNHRDKAQIQHLARQIYPQEGKFFDEVYSDATDRKFGHLIVDLKSTSKDLLRLSSIDFTKNIIYIYTKK